MHVNANSPIGLTARDVVSQSPSDITPARAPSVITPARVGVRPFSFHPSVTSGGLTSVFVSPLDKVSAEPRRQRQCQPRRAEVNGEK